VTKGASDITYISMLSVNFPLEMYRIFGELINNNNDLFKSDKMLTCKVEETEIMFRRFLKVSVDDYLENPRNVDEIQQEFLDLLNPLLDKINNYEEFISIQNKPMLPTKHKLSDLISQPKDKTLNDIFNLIVDLYKKLILSKIRS
jgi:hypothetical protein